MTITRVTKTLFLGFLLLGSRLVAGERTVPVDILLMIDKSLSMAEEGKFDSLRRWSRDHLVTQMLIPGDRISIWQFYGRAEMLLDRVVPPDGDTSEVVRKIEAIVPDGEYTDIGLALDTIRETISGWEDTDRLRILYMLTDLKQEAPWSSRYAGVEDRYSSPYLAEARILEHENWYEITLDMDIQDRVAEETKRLYESILASGSDPREKSEGLGSQEELSGEVQAPDAGEEAPEGGAEAPERGTAREGALSREGSLPLPAAGVLVVVLAAAATLAIVFAARRSRRKREEESEKPLDRT